MSCHITIPNIFWRERKAGDFTLAAFFDLFNHRIVSLFYRAWEKHRFPRAFN